LSSQFVSKAHHDKEMNSFQIFDCVGMEVVPYDSLYKFLHQSSFPDPSWSMRLKIALNIAEGMKYLHTLDPPVLHLDLKSPNILMSSLENSDVVCKVTDFGTAQATYFPLTTRFVDNPTWLAPETLQRRPYYTAADVYSFGVILYEIATRKEFFGEERFFSQIEKNVLSGNRPDIPPSVPTAIAELISQCWSSNPAQRPSFANIVDLISQMNVSA